MFSGKHSELTNKILQAFHLVYVNLGYGFSEKVYQNALVLELKRLGLSVESPKEIDVYYQG